MADYYERDKKYRIRASYRAVYEEYYHLGYNVAWLSSVASGIVECIDELPPHRGTLLRFEVHTKVVISRDITLCLPPAFTLVSSSAYSSTVKMELICSCETSVDFQRTAWRYIPADSTLCDNKFSGSIKVRKFLDQLSDCQLLKEVPAGRICNCNFSFKC
jgi:hypothetical protein